jgi:hypothetical protein
MPEGLTLAGAMTFLQHSRLVEVEWWLMHRRQRESVGITAKIAEKGLNQVRILYDVDLYELMLAVTC